LPQGIRVFTRRLACLRERAREIAIVVIDENY